ncbi:hypothetical protein D3C87_2139600 [compost metagenome]
MCPKTNKTGAKYASVLSFLIMQLEFFWINDHIEGLDLVMAIPLKRNNYNGNSAPQQDKAFISIDP